MSESPDRVTTMIDHFGINCADLEAAKRFYDTVLAVLGYGRQMDFDEAVG
jgi:catechol 2,3-dioxygenase-like lactoylglutathione lyase family enzyme